MVFETVRARGHPNVTATHRSTFELTGDADIGPAADCIIAVRADRSAATLSDRFRAAAARDDARVTAIIRCGGCSDTVIGRGSARMTFADDRSMVFRVSDFVCGRTVMVDADRAARGLDRRLVAALTAGLDVEVELRVDRAARPAPSFDVLFEG
ncbi:MAG TPA: DUF371 domain-containing protein [Methanocella sp.]|nr:DUF371 domain-containing protein [Methanocella sp.]